MNLRSPLRRGCWWLLFGLVALSAVLTVPANGQTSSTGALTGVTMGPSGAVVPNVLIHLVSQQTGESQLATSDQKGRFGFLLLPPPQLSATDK